MGKTRTHLSCSECDQQVAQWMGRCPGCGAWGTIEVQATAAAASAVLPLVALGTAGDAGRRVGTGFSELDRVLGGGIVPGSVSLLAGEPGIPHARPPICP